MGMLDLAHAPAWHLPLDGGGWEGVISHFTDLIDLPPSSMRHLPPVFGSPRPLRQRDKREHGADYPSGAKTVAAPATVSGELLSHATGHRAGKARGAISTASQETCQPTAGLNAHSILAHGGCRHEYQCDDCNPESCLCPSGSSPASIALLLGLMLLAGTGFAGDFRLHNGAHDTRHSMGFPCH